MEIFIQARVHMYRTFKKLVERKNEDDNEDLNDLEKKQLLEYKEILLDVVNNIDEAIGYISDNENTEESEKREEDDEEEN